MVAWMTYFLSSSTVFKTSADSALTSALMGKFRLTRIFFDLKSTTPNLAARSEVEGENLTRVQVVLVLLLVDQDLGLD